MIRGRDIQCFGDWTGLWPLAFGIGTLAFIGPVRSDWSYTSYLDLPSAFCLLPSAFCPPPSALRLR